MTKVNVRTPHFWALSMVGVGTLFITVGMTSMNWRVDTIGTSNMEDTWYTSFNASAWSARSYGLFQVKGQIRQAWTTLTRTTCDLRDVSAMAGAIVGLGKAFENGVDVKTGSFGCDKSESCMGGYTAHLATRCAQYQKMQSISMVTLFFTFIGLMMVFGGLMCGCQCKANEYGGLVAGTCIFGGIMIALINGVWAWVSDSAFKEIGNSAWFPYPTLGWGYYCHLFGALFTLIGAFNFMWLTHGEYMNHDAIMDRLKRKENRLIEKKVQLAKAQHAQQQAQLQGHMQQQQMQQQMQHMAMQQPAGMMMQQQQVGYDQYGNMLPQNAMYAQAGGPAPTEIGASNVQVTMMQGGMAQGGMTPAPGAYSMPAAPPVA